MRFALSGEFARVVRFVAGPSFFCAPPLGSLRADRSRTLLEDFFVVVFVGLIAIWVPWLFSPINKPFTRQASMKNGDSPKHERESLGARFTLRGTSRKFADA